MPTYDFDETNPVDTMVVSAYPSNARDMRAQLDDWVKREHALTGRHLLPAGDDTARGALTDLQAGVLFLHTVNHWLQRRGASAWDGDFRFCPPGIMAPYGGGTVPAGWLLCDGTAYDTTVYPYSRLYAAISSTYNTQWKSDGTQWTAPADISGHPAFRVPDTRGFVLLGRWAGGDGDGDYATLGGAYGGNNGAGGTYKRFKVLHDNIEQAATPSALTAAIMSDERGIAGGGTYNTFVRTAGDPVSLAHTHTFGKVGANLIDGRQRSLVANMIIST